MLECIVVGLGGFVGAVCRYLIGIIAAAAAKQSACSALAVFTGH